MLLEMLAELEFSNSLKASSYLDMQLHSDSSLTPSTSAVLLTTDTVQMGTAHPYAPAI